MTDDPKKKPTAGFWVTVGLLVALVAYPLSFGPVCRFITGRFYKGERQAARICYVYSPLGSLAFDGPAFVRVPLVWYVSPWIPDGIDRIIVYRMDGKWGSIPKVKAH
jgi:hypothetical protein